MTSAIYKDAIAGYQVTSFGVFFPSLCFVWINSNKIVDAYITSYF